MCSTLCFYDTRGHGRAVLRHAPHVVVMTTIGYPRSWEGRAETAPHVVVMTTVGCLLGEARSAVQPTLLLSGSYVVRPVKPTSTSILAEEG